MLKKVLRLCLAGFLLLLALPAPASKGNKSSGKDLPPKPIYTPDPDYTLSAQRDKVQGTVAVSLELDASGIPRDPKVVRSLRPDLDQKAIEAVSKWKFTPAMKDGKPIPASLTVEVSFRLH